MDMNTKIEILECYILSGKSGIKCIREYKRRHNLKKDPFSASTVNKLMKKFFKTGNLNDLPRPGRPSIGSKRNMDAIKQALDQSSGLISIRQISRQTDLKKSSVHNILTRNLKVWPYQISLHQTLHDGDKVKRLQFATWLMEQDSISDILWSDESNISLDGNINRHNCRIWSTSNPHIVQTQPLHSPHLTVWMGFNCKFGLTPFFFEGTVNAIRYKEMLENHVIPGLKQKHAFKRTIFHQDGAPPHRSLVVRDFLNKQFPGRVIGLGFDITWPPRSPDLNPLDYWFWGWLKTKLFNDPFKRPSSLPDLKDEIIRLCATLTSEDFSAAVSHLYTRLELLKNQNGDLFEQFF